MCIPDRALVAFGRWLASHYSGYPQPAMSSRKVLHCG
jgi:hypothetical protein